MLGRRSGSWSWGQSLFAPLGLKSKSVDHPVAPGQQKRKSSAAPVAPAKRPTPVDVQLPSKKGLLSAVTVSSTAASHQRSRPLSRDNTGRFRSSGVHRGGGASGASSGVHRDRGASSGVHRGGGNSGASSGVRSGLLGIRPSSSEKLGFGAASHSQPTGGVKPSPAPAKSAVMSPASNPLKSGRCERAQAKPEAPAKLHRSSALGKAVLGVAGVARCGSSAKSKSSGVLAKKVQKKVSPSIPAKRVQVVPPGPVDETASQHAARHPTPVSGCTRCVYTQSRALLERGYGAYSQGSGGVVRKHVWLAARPVRLGGLWAVGCTFCAHLRQIRADARDHARREGQQRLKNRRRGPGDANTRWARFEMQSPLQIASRGVRQHAETLQHRLAVRAFFAPAAAVVLQSEAAEDDLQLFRGGVPQVEDWLRAWRVCRTPQSFAAAEAHGITENFIKGSRVPGVSARAFQTMVRVMCFTLRLRKRVALRTAKAMSVGLDDRGGYRVVSFKTCDAKGKVSSGCLCVLRRGGRFSEKHLEDADEDYSRDMGNSIIRAIERVVTDPHTNSVDNELVDHICSVVYLGVADGAICAQKCLKFLAVGRMPNMLWVGRDRAHAARIATSGPLVKEATFGAWFDDVFDQRHALVPDIKNSEEWSAKLILCARHVIATSDADTVFRSCGVQKTLSFAKQRFDSMGTPQLQFCVMLLGIAMLLAFVSSDTRTSAEVKKRARRRLREMPGWVPVSGVSASYSDEAIRFIRLFDVADHDPALTYRQTLRFEARMRVLFIDGRIWDEDERDTPLALALRHARESPPLYYDEDGKILHLYRKMTAEQAKDLADGIEAIVTSMTDRIHVDFSSDDLAVLFTCFDLVRWHEANETMKAGDRTKHMLLDRHLYAMFRGWKLSRSSVPVFKSVANRLLDIEGQHLKANAPRDNRTAWAQVLESSLFQANDLTDDVQLMVCIYLASRDSTCGIERDLGALSKVLEVHRGPVDDDATTISSCVEVLLDGPQSEADLGYHLAGEGESPESSSSHSSCLVATDFTRECASLWVDLRGRRFRVYRPGNGKKPGPKPGKNKNQKGLTGLKVRVKAAMDRLASRGSGGLLSQSTILSLPRDSFCRRPGQANPAKQSVNLKKFDNWTKKKRIMATHLQQARKMVRGNPYTSSDLDPRRKLRRGHVISGHQLPREPGTRRVQRSPGGAAIVAVDACKVSVPEREGYRVSRPATDHGASSLVQQVQTSRMVIMDSPWQCDNLSSQGDLALAIYFATVALGKPTIGRVQHLQSSSLGPTDRALVLYRPISRGTKLSIFLGEDFKRERPLLRDVISGIVKMRDSVWTLADESGSACVRIRSPSDVRSFLLDFRRAGHSGGGVLGSKSSLARPSA